MNCDTPMEVGSASTTPMSAFARRPVVTRARARTTRPNHGEKNLRVAFQNSLDRKVDETRAQFRNCANDLVPWGVVVMVTIPRPGIMTNSGYVAELMLWMGFDMTQLQRRLLDGRKCRSGQHGFFTRSETRLAAWVVLPMLSARASKNSKDMSAYNVAVCCAWFSSRAPSLLLSRSTMREAAIWRRWFRRRPPRRIPDRWRRCRECGG